VRPKAASEVTGPSRVFFDLRGVQVAPELKDVVLRYTADAVKQIRVRRHPGNNTVRVVLDLTDVKKYSVCLCLAGSRCR
jgi:hypothetical protein